MGKRNDDNDAVAMIANLSELTTFQLLFILFQALCLSTELAPEDKGGKNAENL